MSALTDALSGKTGGPTPPKQPGQSQDFSGGSALVDTLNQGQKQRNQQQQSQQQQTGSNQKNLQPGATDILPNGVPYYGSGWQGWAAGANARINAPNYQKMADGTYVQADINPLMKAARVVKEGVGAIGEGFQVAQDTFQKALAVPNTMEKMGDYANSFLPDISKGQEADSWIYNLAGPGVVGLLYNTARVLTGTRKMPWEQVQKTFEGEALLSSKLSGTRIAQKILGSDLLKNTDVAKAIVNSPFGKGLADATVREEFLRRFNAGENPDYLVASMANPFAEMAFDMVVDPFTVAGPIINDTVKAIQLGKTRLGFQTIDELKDGWKAVAATEDITAHSPILADMAQKLLPVNQKSELLLHSTNDLINPFRLDSIGKQNKLADVVGNFWMVLTGAFKDHPDDLNDALRASALIGSQDAGQIEEGLKIYRSLNVGLGELATSPEGLQAGKFLNKMLSNEAGDITGGKMESVFEALKTGDTGQAVEAWNKATGKTLDEMYPTVLEMAKQPEKYKVPDWAVQVAKAHEFAQQKLKVASANKFFSTIYITTNPGVGFRNLTNNITTSTIHFGPQSAIDTLGAFAQEMGGKKPDVMTKLEDLFGGMAPVAANQGLKAGTGGGALEGGSQLIKSIASITDKGERASSITTVYYSAKKTLAGVFHEGIAIAPLDDLRKLGIPEDQAGYLISLVQKHNGDVGKALDIWMGEAGSGAMDTFRNINTVMSKSLVKDARSFGSNLLEDMQVALDAPTLEEAVKVKQTILQKWVDTAKSAADGFMPGLEDGSPEGNDVLTALKMGMMEDPNKNLAFKIKLQAQRVGEEILRDSSEKMFDNLLGEAATRGDMVAHQGITTLRQTLRDTMKGITKASEHDTLRETVRFLTDPKSTLDGQAITDAAIKTLDGFGDYLKNPNVTDNGIRDAIWQYYFGKRDAMHIEVMQNIRSAFADTFAGQDMLAFAKRNPLGDQLFVNALDEAQKYEAIAKADMITKEGAFRDSVKFWLDEGRPDTAILAMAKRDFGIASISEKGVPAEKAILNIINANLPEGTAKFASIKDIPFEVAQSALQAHATKPAKIAEMVAQGFDPSVPMDVARQQFNPTKDAAKQLLDELRTGQPGFRQSTTAGMSANEVAGLAQGVEGTVSSPTTNAKFYQELYSKGFKDKGAIDNILQKIADGKALGTTIPDDVIAMRENYNIYKDEANALKAKMKAAPSGSNERMRLEGLYNYAQQKVKGEGYAYSALLKKNGLTTEMVNNGNSKIGAAVSEYVTRTAGDLPKASLTELIATNADPKEIQKAADYFDKINHFGGKYTPPQLANIEESSNILNSITAKTSADDLVKYDARLQNIIDNNGDIFDELVTTKNVITDALEKMPEQDITNAIAKLEKSYNITPPAATIQDAGGVIKNISANSTANDLVRADEQLSNIISNTPDITTTKNPVTDALAKMSDKDLENGIQKLEKSQGIGTGASEKLAGTAEMGTGAPQIQERSGVPRPGSYGGSVVDPTVERLSQIKGIDGNISIEALSKGGFSDAEITKLMDEGYFTIAPGNIKNPQISPTEKLTSALSELPTPADLTKGLDKLEQPLWDGMPPNSGQAASGNLKGVNRLLDQFEAGLRSSWDKGSASTKLTPEQLAAAMKWKDETVGKVAYARAVAARVAQQERDFILLNYGQKTTFDRALAYVMPYQFWYSRSYKNWIGRLATHPELITHYSNYKKWLDEQHSSLPEWWRYNVSVNDLPGVHVDNPLFFNLEATLNPLNGVTGIDFNDPNKIVGDPGTFENYWTSTLDGLGKFGPGVFSPISMATGLYLGLTGEQDAARRWAGRLFPQTATIKAVGAEMGVNAELDPMVWLSGGKLSTSAVDPYEERRVGRMLSQMAFDKTITQEQAIEAARQKSGPLWEQAVLKATQQRAGGQIASFGLGVGFKGRNETDMQIDQFYEDYNNLWKSADSYSPQNFKVAMDKMRETYPFMDAVLLSKKNDIEVDRAYAYNVLGRITPGDSTAILKSVGLTPDIINKFYNDKGQINKWPETDKERFTAAMISVGTTLAIPKTATQQEWTAAKNEYSLLTKHIADVLGQDTVDKIDIWFKLPTDQQDAYINANPKVGQAMDYKAYAISQSPLLSAYYNGIGNLENYYKGMFARDVVNKLGADYYDKVAEQANILDPAALKRYNVTFTPLQKQYNKLKTKWDDYIQRKLLDYGKSLPTPLVSEKQNVDMTSLGQQAVSGAVDAQQAANAPKVRWQDISAQVPDSLKLALGKYFANQRPLTSAEKSTLNRTAKYFGLAADDIMAAAAQMFP